MQSQDFLKENKKKIMVVENNSAPYRDDTFYEVRRNSNTEWLILTEYRKGHNDNHSEWEYVSPNEDIRCYSYKTLKFRIFTYKYGFIKIILKYRPDVVITDSIFEGIIARYITRSRIVMYADTMKIGRHGRSLWNKIILTWLYKKADAVWVPGEAGKKYFKSYLKDRRPIYCGTYTEDANKKIHKIKGFREIRDELRALMGFDEHDFVFLFVGKLIPTRHVEVLLKSMKILANENEKIKTLIIGDGPGEKMVQEYILSEENIKWIPRVSLQELEKNYALADAYVHPGEEPYSLALYEAAIAGIPILAAQEVGATADCLRDGKNGYLLKYCNPSDMCGKMIKVANGEISKKETEKMQQFILNKRGIAWSSEQLMKACNLN